MAQYQLKVMLNTSIPSSVGYTELTIDILNYAPPTGKPKKMAKYPFFDPTANYPRKIIQDLEYYKRLEIFFNEDKFKSVVLQYSNQSKVKDKEKKTDQKISNFEFTIQTILCTGFPVNNYFQSMEYYDPQIRSKYITLKGSSWFPFLPGRFDRTFSHLKLEGGIHTVTGVVWVNDALNHPKYFPVLESFGKYNEEKTPEEIENKKNDLNDRRDLEINMFILNLYQDNLNQSTAKWRSESDSDIDRKIGSRNTTQDITSGKIQKSFQSLILKELKHAPPIKNFFEDLSFSNPPRKYSSIYDLAHNVYYLRGGLEKESEEAIELKKQSVELNKPYFFWKQIHENATHDVSGIKHLTKSAMISGVFCYNELRKCESNETLRKYFIGTKSIDLYTNIYKTYMRPQEFLDLSGGLLSADHLRVFLDDYSQTIQYENEVKKKNEVNWFYQTLFESYKDIKKRANDTSFDSDKQAAYSAIVKLMKSFIDTEQNSKDNYNQEVKDNLLRFINMYTDEDFSTLSGVGYGSDLRKFISKMRKFDTEARAYEFVSSNTDYTDDKNKADIDIIIAEKFKNFNVFSTSLKELAVSRIVSNPYWKIETDKFVGAKKGKITLKEKGASSKGIFETLSACKDVNKRCKNDEHSIKFLNVGLDEIKDGKSKGFQTVTVYEAYVQANVIKGKITKENYGKLKCSYLNYSLGAMFQRLKKKTSENFIVKNKVYFDLEEEIKKAEALVSSKPPKKNKTPIKNKPVNNKSKIKRGGRRSRKRFVKKMRFTKNIKSKNKNKNKNKTRRLRY
jgi:hypothetical protein